MSNRQTKNRSETENRDHDYYLRSSRIMNDLETTTNRRELTISRDCYTVDKSLGKEYFGEKNVVPTPPKKKENLKNYISKAPVFCTTNVLDRDARKHFTKSLQQKIDYLHAKQVEISKEINELKDQHKRKEEKKLETPNDWTYKNHLVRVTHFDERTTWNGQKTNTPRVVTVVWKHQRQTGSTRYAAVVWTQGPGNDKFDKETQKRFAMKRYTSNPVLVVFKPSPKTLREVSNCLRVAIYEMGVCSTSKTHLKWKHDNLVRKTKK